MGAAFPPRQKRLKRTLCLIQRLQTWSSYRRFSSPRMLQHTLTLWLARVLIVHLSAHDFNALGFWKKPKVILFAMNLVLTSSIRTQGPILSPSIHYRFYPGIKQPMGCTRKNQIETLDPAVTELVCQRQSSLPVMLATKQSLEAL